MKVAVKKRVLVNVLNNAINLKENRTNDNPGGNFIHPNNLKKAGPFNIMIDDPYGANEDDAPIIPSSHMAVQLSVESPPVEDEDFVPATIEELCSSAVVICKEVPLSQIEFFYRQLHILLDKALDREEEAGLDVLNEAISISRKTTIQDLMIISETIRVRKRARKEKLPNLPGQLSDEDLPGIENAQNRDEYMRGYDFAANFEVEGKSEDELEQHDDYVASQSDDFKRGYDAGDDVREMTITSKQKSLFPDLKKAEEFEYENYMDYQVKSRDEEGDSYDRLVKNTHAILQRLSKEAQAERTLVYQMRTEDPKGYGKMPDSYFDSLMPITKKYNLGQDEALTPLLVKKMFKSKKAAAGAPIILYQRIHGMITQHMKLSNRFKIAVADEATKMNTSVEEVVKGLSETIAGDYSGYATSSRFETDEDLISHAIQKAFSHTVTREPYAYKDISHFERQATQDLFDAVVEDVTKKFEKKLKGNTYKIKDADKEVDIAKDEFEERISSFIKIRFERAEEVQSFSGKDSSRADTLDIDTDDDLEDAEAKAYLEELIKQEAKFKKASDWTTLAPFFGFSGAPGLRQWFLKHVHRKIQVMGAKDERGAKSDFGKIYNEGFEAIILPLISVIKKEIESLEKKGDASNQSLILLKQALPELESINDYLEEKETSIFDIALNKDPVGLEWLYTVGGGILRIINADIAKPIFNMLDNDWTSYIAEIIMQKVPAINLKNAKGLSQYFTGLKNKPDFAAQTKAAKNLLKAGITPKVYVEIMIESMSWFDEIAAIDNFARHKTREGTFAGEYREALIKAINTATDKPSKMLSYVKKAVKEYLEDYKGQQELRRASGEGKQA